RPCDPRIVRAAVRAAGRRQHRGHRRRRGELAVEALDRELALEAGDAEHFRARHRAARADADRLQQLMATAALRRRGGARHRSGLYTRFLADATRCRFVARSHVHVAPEETWRALNGLPRCRRSRAVRRWRTRASKSRRAMVTAPAPTMRRPTRWWDPARSPRSNRLPPARRRQRPRSNRLRLRQRPRRLRP